MRALLGKKSKTVDTGLKRRTVERGRSLWGLPHNGCFWLVEARGRCGRSHRVARLVGKAASLRSASNSREAWRPKPGFDERR